jgi:RHS repeat-associated protein
MIHNKSLRLLLLTGIMLLGFANSSFSQLWNPSHAIGTVTGNYNFSYNQTPDQLVEIYPAGVPNTGLSYQWESSTMPVTGFASISGAVGSSYSPGPVTQTMYYKRRTTNSLSQSIYSNTIKILVVSANWEDLNYVREHEVNTTNITTWQAVDQLTIGQKLQTTTYMDGMGRPIQQVSRETAATPTGAGLWGDIVRFYQYDAYGREPAKYLPYTTTNQSGKFKTTSTTDQPQYYSTIYNETAAFASVTFDNSPLKRVLNAKEPGTSWAASNGNSASYDMNSAADNVQMLVTDYIQGNAPVNKGVYPVNRLYKLAYTDVNGKQVIEYSDKSGQLILKKIQLDNAPTQAHTGWICTYYVYDDFGLLRFQLQPEAVKYLDANAWSFAGTNGQQVLNEWCFQYNYDDRGNMVWKKAPGAVALNMVYDIRNRLVLTQDGNQAAMATPQWTITLYDELDRAVITALYNITKSIATLQADINSAPVSSSLTIANPANTGGGASVFLTTSLSPIQSTELNNTAVATIVRYLFYDNYNFSGVKTFNTNYNNLSAYNNSDPNVIPIATSKRTLSLPTGGKTRVLGSASTFLPYTKYYDEKGQHIQTLEDNIKSGADITTYQYHFDGRMLSSCADHTTAGTGYTNFKTLSKYLFDKLGRVTSIQKQFDGNTLKTISSYEYDDVGRLKTRRLDPGYTAGGNTDLESLDYSYNLHNRITGINKDYALKNSGTYNKWGHFFGMYLGFDNRDNVFTAAQLNGTVAGILWNTQGDDAQRRYNYSYDNAGRLINAAFTEKQHTGDSWSNSKMDFSVTGSSGQLTYDLNSNLLTMLQKGVVPGNAAPVALDNLSYTYAAYSNKLQSVTDQMTVTTANGLSGDFKDGSNGAGTPDYVYDANGNLVIDLNKSVQSLNGGAPGTNGISYNYLDKPEVIRVTGKGTIRFVYSADGDKLQRAFIPESGGPATITSYIDDFVYQETAAITPTTAVPFGGTPSLVYIDFEEGRIRVITPVAQNNGYDAMNIAGNITLPNSKAGVFDYFLMDYQQNVRMILTEEAQSAGNTCTMEIARAGAEDPVFGQTGSANEVEVTRYNKPAGWTAANLGSSVSRLGNIAAYNLGPNTLQKVMAGDKVTASVSYYYQSATGGSNPNIANTILSGLAQAITGNKQAGTLLKSNVAGISSQLGASAGFLGAVQPAGSGGATPQAYLTILFFDERFNFIEAADGGVAQQQVAASVTSAGDLLGLGSVKAPKNGYVYVYVSNRSDQDVYFDNLQASIVRGNIVEENHYYAYGLKIAGISSRKAADVNEGMLKNNNLYNDKEFTDDADLNWYDYGYRSYDPQIGRFVQFDPLADYYAELTPYQYASCDPIANVDLDGLEGVTSLLSDIPTGALAIQKTLEPVVVVGHIAKKAASFWSVTGSFFKGVGQSLWGTVKGVGQMIAHPVQTVTGIVHAVTHPVETAKAIGNAVVETYKAFKDGDANTRANILGKLVGEVGQTLVGGTAVKVVTKLAKEAKIVSKIAKVEKAVEAEAKVAVAVEKAAAVEAKGGVYVLKDGDKVVRTGRTNDMARRAAEHANDPALKKFTFEPRYKTDVYAEQRGLEHALYEQYKSTAAKGNGGYNKIKAIGDANKKKNIYIKAAEDYLKKQ